jgi:hypothetical protein
MKLRFFSLVMLLTFISIIPSSIVLADDLPIRNTFIGGDLRYDLSDIYNAQDYIINIRAGSIPSGNSYTHLTTGWLGVDLAQYVYPIDYSGHFIQVGYEASPGGIIWFVYAEPGISYCRTTNRPDSRHCYGNFGDIVELGDWHWMEIKKTVNTWSLYVLTTNNFAVLVADVVDNSNRIYYITADAEEITNDPFDPFIDMQYTFEYPKYLKNGVWQDWPNNLYSQLPQFPDNSAGAGYSHFNLLFAAPPPPPSPVPDWCPTYYGATPNYDDIPRRWYAGTGGYDCFDFLYPAHTINLPLIINNP